MPTKVPDWAKFALVVAGILCSLAFGWGDLKADLRVETTQRQMENQSAKDSTQRIEKSIEEIRTMLQDEMERHHPRK